MLGPDLTPEDRLRSLDDLHQRGLISDAEYERERPRLPATPQVRTPVLFNEAGTASSPGCLLIAGAALSLVAPALLAAAIVSPPVAVALGVADGLSRLVLGAVLCVPSAIYLGFIAAAALRRDSRQPWVVATALALATSGIGLVVALPLLWQSTRSQRRFGLVSLAILLALVFSVGFWNVLGIAEASTLRDQVWTGGFEQSQGACTQPAAICVQQVAGWSPWLVYGHTVTYDASPGHVVQHMQLNERVGPLYSIYVHADGELAMDTPLASSFESEPDLPHPSCDGGASQPLTVGGVQGRFVTWCASSKYVEVAWAGSRQSVGLTADFVFSDEPAYPAQDIQEVKRLLSAIHWDTSVLPPPR